VVIGVAPTLKHLTDVTPVFQPGAIANMDIESVERKATASGCSTACAVGVGHRITIA
jgi:hypothetical protein